MTVTATAHVDAPCPRVEIDASGFAGATSVTITRTFDGTTEQVRGMVKKTTSFPLLEVDYEAPLGRPVTYTVTGYAGQTVVATESSAAVTVTPEIGNPSWVWVQDPYAPATAMCLPMERGSVGTLSFSREAHVSRLIDSRDVIAVGGRMSRADDVPWSILTEGDDVARQFEDLVADAFTLSLRALPQVPLPGVAYVLASEMTAEPVDAADDDPREMWRWAVPLRLVRGPAAGYAVPVHTWGDVNDIYPTWGALRSAKATWGDVKRNPDPGV